MEGNIFVLAFSFFKPFMILIGCLSVFIIVSHLFLKESAGFLDHFINLLIVAGAIAWVVFTS